jgi:hypothetical protein
VLQRPAGSVPNTHPSVVPLTEEIALRAFTRPSGAGPASGLLSTSVLLVASATPGPTTTLVGPAVPPSTPAAPSSTSTAMEGVEASSA